jgi:putative methylase
MITETHECFVTMPPFRKKQLEILLSKLQAHPHPKFKYETYSLDTACAAQFLHIAGYIYQDITEKQVIDLGCGAGILAIGAKVLGAANVTGIDIDPDSISIAARNAKRIGVHLNLIIGDINILHSRKFDTTVMNPPFGSWHKGMDMSFLEKALELASTIYSLHKRSLSSRQFIARKVKQWGGSIDRIFEMQAVLRPTFSFHRQSKYYVECDLYRIVSY